MATILITGGSRGFGALAGLRFAGMGHDVVVTTRAEGPHGRGIRSVVREGETLQELTLDVDDGASVEDGLARAVSAVGPIDVLVNNAALFEPGPVELTSDEVARRMFETNFFGVLRTTKAVLPSMRARRAGAIVNVTSMLAHVPAPLSGVYAATKQAVTAITEALAVELDAFGIRVATVAPGPYRTRMTEPRPPVAAGTPYAELEQRLVARREARLAAAGDPGEVVDAIVEAAFGARPRLRVPTRAIPDDRLRTCFESVDARVSALLGELGLRP